jgi:monomeric sarcosine oxidase
MSHYDAIVLGTGGIGSAALYEFARRGIRAIGIDRFHPPHERGSSHGQTRVIRQAYFEHSDYVPLALASYRLWRELELHTGRSLLHECGLVQVGPPNGLVVPGVLNSAEQHRLSVQQLSAERIERRWPGLRVPGNLTGVYEPAAGYLLVEDCVQAHLDAARAAGGILLEETEVLGWQIDDTRVEVQTSRGPFTSAHLVVTAGAWAAQVLAGASLNLTPSLSVRRKSLFWYETSSTAYDANRGCPVYLFELPQGVFYGFPKLDARGVKVGEHTGGRIVGDPLDVDRTADPAEQAALTAFLAAHMPGVSRRVTDHSVCLYTMSPDEHFIVDRHPAHPQIAFAAGLSGHGFKFAPVLGRALADLVLDGATELPIAFLSLRRFG